MNRFKTVSALIILAEMFFLVVGNLLIFNGEPAEEKKYYRVEAKRVLEQLKDVPIERLDLSGYETIVAVEYFHPEEACQNAYIVEQLDGTLYRIEYKERIQNNNKIFLWNAIMTAFLLFTIGVLFFFSRRLLQPFVRMRDYAVELAKGNLTTPLKAEKSRYFGEFQWGLDMLREHLEDNHRREMDMQREKKTLILSLSHDIKTPLAAIELYTKALQENLYESEEKRQDVLKGISNNALEIKDYINQITEATRGDFLDLHVEEAEFYLKSVMDKIQGYYADKLSVIHTEFVIEQTENCLLRGDADRLVEVLQNLIENAIKYGDGKFIHISFSEEEDCKLIRVENSGADLREEELHHLFDSFYRGSNSKKAHGSGLGLYISKELMQKMGGDLFAQLSGNTFSVTAVIKKA